jgi:hypothetical protein
MAASFVFAGFSATTGRGGSGGIVAMNGSIVGKVVDFGIVAGGEGSWLRLNLFLTCG